MCTCVKEAARLYLMHNRKNSGPCCQRIRFFWALLSILYEAILRFSDNRAAVSKFDDWKSFEQVSMILTLKREKIIHFRGITCKWKCGNKDFDGESRRHVTQSRSYKISVGKFFFTMFFFHGKKSSSVAPIIFFFNFLLIFLYKTNKMW